MPEQAVQAAASVPECCLVEKPRVPICAYAPPNILNRGGQNAVRTISGIILRLR
jgi:hypothetical protein